MDPSCLGSTVQAEAGVMVRGDIFMAHFEPFRTTFSVSHHFVEKLRLSLTLCDDVGVEGS